MQILILAEDLIQIAVQQTLQKLKSFYVLIYEQLHPSPNYISQLTQYKKKKKYPKTVTIQVNCVMYICTLY